MIFYIKHITGVHSNLTLNASLSLYTQLRSLLPEAPDNLRSIDMNHLKSYTVIIVNRKTNYMTFIPLVLHKGEVKYRAMDINEDIRYIDGLNHRGKFRLGNMRPRQFKADQQSELYDLTYLAKKEGHIAR